MPTEFHLLVQQVLDRAADMEPSQRATFIRRSCAGKTRLRREVDSLLPYYLDMHGFEPPATPWNPPGPSTCARARFDAELANDGDAEPQPPFMVDQYRALALIGRGGMASVFKAVAVAGSRAPVAIKILSRELLSAESRQRFEFEAQLVRQLRHPGIARILQTGAARIRWNRAGGAVDEMRPYYVMEFVDGSSALDFADAKQLDLFARLRFLVQICGAVQYAHHRGIIHRDLKPDNIIVDRAGQPKLLDFGIARHVDYQPTLAREVNGRFMGTPEYASPEQVAGRMETLTPRCDVYALGVIAHELLTGKLPKYVSGRLRISLGGVSLSPNPGRVDEKSARYYLTRLLSKALMKSEEQRYADAGQLAEALEDFIALCSARSRWSTFKKGIASLLSPNSKAPGNSLSRPLTAILGRRVASAVEADKRR